MPRDKWDAMKWDGIKLTKVRLPKSPSKRKRVYRVEFEMIDEFPEDPAIMKDFKSLLVSTCNDEYFSVKNLKIRRKKV